MPDTDEALRIQPHDHNAEQAILGALLIDNAALAPVQAMLSAGDFYDTRHQQIFAAMIELAAAGAAIDLLTIGDLLDRKGQLKSIGGQGAVADLLTTVASASNVLHHAHIVRDHAIRRRLIRLSTAILERSYDHAPTGSLLRDLEHGIVQVRSAGDDASWHSLADVTNETVQYVDRVSKRGEALIGIPTGYQVLDKLVGGWQRSDLIIIGARPSMGKTALALGSALAAAEQGFHVGIVSLEMSRLQLGQRLHGMKAPIDVHAIRTGSLTPEGWWVFANTAQQLERLPLWVADTSLLTVEHLIAKARQLQTQHQLDLLVVDYLQLLQSDRAENRQQGVADASRKLKLLAKELNIPVLALSQLSRACEQRDDSRPMLSDLRDSGGIEQDADIVLFIYREEVYTPDTEEKGMAEILVRKHRNGPIGDRRLKFEGRFARFENLTQENA